VKIAVSDGGKIPNHQHHRRRRRVHRNLLRLLHSRTEVTRSYYQKVHHYEMFKNYYWSRKPFGDHQVSTAHSWLSLVCTAVRIYIVTPDDQGQSPFYVVRTLQFGMKLYNDQRNAQVFNLSICLFMPYMFRTFFLVHLQR
jgi:hypothetical protein